MQLTYKFNYYKNFSRLNNLCKISKNLYNQGNYLIKQELENKGNLLTPFKIRNIFNIQSLNKVMN